MLHDGVAAYATYTWSNAMLWTLIIHASDERGLECLCQNVPNALSMHWLCSTAICALMLTARLCSSALVSSSHFQSQGRRYAPCVCGLQSCSCGANPLKCLHSLEQQQTLRSALPTQVEVQIAYLQSYEGMGTAEVECTSGVGLPHSGRGTLR